MTSKPQVVVTGLGTVNGLGTNVATFWNKLIAGQSAATQITSFDSTKWRTHLACEITDELTYQQFPDRTYNLLYQAAHEALDQAGQPFDPERTGVVIGSLEAATNALEHHLAERIKAGQPLNLATQYPYFLMSGLSRFLANQFNYNGPVITSGIACAASAAAISRAADLIKLGHAEVMVTGGVDSFSQISFSGFNTMRSAAATKCQPFSKDREGLIIGDGAGILVLESLEHARRRGAAILAVILGTGLAEDAYHITAPDPEGSGAIRSMQAALRDAGLSPQDIDYVNAHGTGTPQNDRMESKALKTVFGPAMQSIPVSSIKAAIGHCMGAAGGIEAVASVLSLLNGLMPPTLNFVPGDEACDLDYVPNQSRSKVLKTVLSNSFGFAGNNGSVIFGHPSYLEGGQ